MNVNCSVRAGHVHIQGDVGTGYLWMIFETMHGVGIELRPKLYVMWEETIFILITYLYNK